MQGKSIKEFVLERTLGTDDEADAQLEAFLEKRLAQAESGEVSKRTVSEIFEDAIDAAESRPKP